MIFMIYFLVRNYLCIPLRELGKLHNCSCNVVKELHTLQERDVDVFYICPQPFIKGIINTTMVELACPEDWSKWYKTAECIEQAGSTDAITPYRRACKSEAGENEKRTCIGPDFKTEPCHYNKSIKPVTRSTKSKLKRQMTLTGLKMGSLNFTYTQIRYILQLLQYSIDDFFEALGKSLVLFYQKWNKNVLSVNITHMTVDIIEYIINLKVFGNETSKDVKLPTFRNMTIALSDTLKVYAHVSNISISDYDECKELVHDCDNNAYCITFTDSISYACQCRNAYVGDGFECKPEEPLNTTDTKKRTGVNDKIKEEIIIPITVVAIISLIVTSVILGKWCIRNNETQNLQIDLNVISQENVHYEEIQNYNRQERGRQADDFTADYEVIPEYGLHQYYNKQSPERTEPNQTDSSEIVYEVPPENDSDHSHTALENNDILSTSDSYEELQHFDREEYATLLSKNEEHQYCNEQSPETAEPVQADSSEIVYEVPPEDDSHEIVYEVPPEDDSHEIVYEVPPEDDSHEIVYEVPPEDDPHEIVYEVPPEDDSHEIVYEVPPEDDPDDSDTMTKDNDISSTSDSYDELQHFDREEYATLEPQQGDNSKITSEMLPEDVSSHNALKIKETSF